MSKEPKRNVYVGHRYVPKIMGEWDIQETYEGLSIVTHQGNSYTSKKRVPVGIDILDEEYWVVTGNYNAQIEQYRQDVRNMQDEVNSKADIVYVDNEINNVNNKIDNVNNEIDNVTQQLEQTETVLSEMITETQKEFDERGFNVTKNEHLVIDGDWTTAIQTALNEHDVVFIPKRNEPYIIGQINLNSNNTIISNGATLKQRDMDTVLLYGEETIRNIVIRGLKFDGSYSENGGDPVKNGIINPGGENYIIEECEFFNVPGSCVASSRGHNIVVRDCVVHDFRDHVVYFTLYSRDILVENVVSYDDVNHRSPYKVRVGTKRYTLRNCKHYGGGQFLNIHNQNNVIEDILVDNCYAETDVSPVLIQTDEGGNPAINVTVKDSVFKNVSLEPYTTINLAHNAKKCVDGFKVLNTKFIDYGGKIILSSTQIDNYNTNIILDGCSFFTREGYEVDYSFNLSYCENVVIKNNYFKYANNGALIGSSAINCVIKDNIFECGTAIYLSSSALGRGHTKIINNRFKCSTFLDGAEIGGIRNGRLFVKDNETTTLTTSSSIDSWGESVIKENNYLSI